MASSLVGNKINTYGHLDYPNFFSFLILSTVGKENDNVFPEPVLSLPIRSLPSKI